MTKKKQKERRYVPSITVPSDDLVVIDEEGTEHHPHAGEHVVFRKGVPLRVMRVMRRVAKMPEFEQLDEEQVAKLDERKREQYKEEQAEVSEQFGDLSDDLVRVMARQILDWNWTDEWGDPLPRPHAGEAFVEALWDLDDEELAWLQAHMTDGANASKN